MFIAGLFDPVVVFQDEELPGFFALGQRSRDFFLGEMLGTLQKKDLLDDLERWPLHEVAEECSFAAGQFVITSFADDRGFDWFIEQHRPDDSEQKALSEPFDATMAFLPA